MSEASPLAQVQEPIPAAYGETIGKAAGVTVAVSMYTGLAIVAALAERGLADPLKVAQWAQFFAESQGKGSPAEVRDAIKGGVLAFANALRMMATKPADGPQLRQ